MHKKEQIKSALTRLLDIVKRHRNDLNFMHCFMAFEISAE